VGACDGEPRCEPHGAPSQEAAGAGSAELSIAWAFPDDGGAQITAFRVDLPAAAGAQPFVAAGDLRRTAKGLERRAGAAAGWRNRSAAPPAVQVVPWQGWGTALTVTGLMADTEYCYEVVALNSRGLSAASVPTCLQTNPATVPAAVESVWLLTTVRPEPARPPCSPIGAACLTAYPPGCGRCRAWVCSRWRGSRRPTTARRSRASRSTWTTGARRRQTHRAPEPQIHRATERQCARATE
jgi:hypothetical protein